MIGLFINTVPVRVCLDPAEPAVGFLRRLQDEQVRLGPHQHLGLARIQALAGGGELFDTAVVFENYPGAGSDPAPGGLRVTGVSGRDATHYPLSLAVVPGDQIAMCLSYRPDLFDAQSAGVVGERLVRVLAAVAADPGVRVSRVEVLSAAERELIVAGWNDTGADIPAGTLPGLFAVQAAVSPAAVAVAEGGVELSYAELDERSSRLARYLIGRGAGPEVVVAIAMQRSALMVTALLGVLKAGAAYLPVDAGYPAERVRFMLADTGPLLVLTDTATVGGLPAAAVPCVVVDDPAVAAGVAALPGTAPGDGDRAVPLRPAHPAYVIYTSGSTGTPKGVTVTHAGIANLAGVDAG